MPYKLPYNPYKLPYNIKQDLFKHNHSVTMLHKKGGKKMKYTIVYKIGETWYFLQFEDLKQLEKFVKNPQIDEWHLAEKPRLKS